MSNPTFDQAFQLLNITRESGVSLETLQAVYNAGLLSDLLKAENPRKVNREEFRRILGYDSFAFKVKMGGSNDTDEIIKALNFPFNDWITQENFPLMPNENPTEDEIEIIDPGCSFNEEQGLQILKEKGLLRPNYEHAIRFAEQYGKTTTSEKKPYVTFLHETWQDPNRDRRIVHLNRDSRYRRIDLVYAEGVFDDDCVLAGVRPRT